MTAHRIISARVAPAFKRSDRCAREPFVAIRPSADRNQHYNDLDCPCWYDPKAMARFKEQPQICSCRDCGNQRQFEGETMQERRAAWPHA